MYDSKTNRDCSRCCTPRYCTHTTRDTEHRTHETQLERYTQHARYTQQQQLVRHTHTTVVAVTTTRRGRLHVALRRALEHLRGARRGARREHAVERLRVAAQRASANTSASVRYDERGGGGKAHLMRPLLKRAESPSFGAATSKLARIVASMMKIEFSARCRPGHALRSASVSVADGSGTGVGRGGDAPLGEAEHVRRGVGRHVRLVGEEEAFGHEVVRAVRAVGLEGDRPANKWVSGRMKRGVRGA